VVNQHLQWGSLAQERPSRPDTLFVTTGRRLYVIGDIDGRFRPRTNPYDLHTFGAPQASDPLAGRLQGVWAQPVKALNGYAFVVDWDDTRWPLVDATRFTQTFVDATFEYRQGPLAATRIDLVAQDRPVLFTTLKLRNDGSDPIDLRVSFQAAFDLRDAHFIAVADSRNEGETVAVDGERLVARAWRLPERWAVAIGGRERPGTIGVTDGPDGHPVGHLGYAAILGPREEREWTIATVVELRSGAGAALRDLDDWLPLRETLQARKRAVYADVSDRGPCLHSPDAAMDAAFAIACANIQALEAESPALGRSFYAGLETFPFWFSADSAYATPGVLAAGFVGTGLRQLVIGAESHVDGRLPHQISPTGAIVVPGNAAETPLWVSAVWDAYRWTGDRGFLASVYPAAVQGLLEHTFGDLDRDGDGYPHGPGMVEREDMGARRLDVAAYAWAALGALGRMADVMGDVDTAARARVRAEQVAAGFDAVWWDPATATYAMSLDGLANERMSVPHWAVVVPLEVGLATPEHAATTLATLMERHVDRWGLVHTVGEDPRVWTLPTAAMSRAAYRFGQPRLGFEMLRRLSATLDHGSIGMHHELLPEGLSVLQLWSAATFVRGVVEDLLGIAVRADRHAVTLSPRPPAEWGTFDLDRLGFGGHVISVRVTPSGSTMSHLSGPADLSVTHPALDGTQSTTVVAPGGTMRW